MIGPTRRPPPFYRLSAGRPSRGATIFLIETIVPSGPEPDWSKMLDIHMLTLLGGKQRTLREYKTLLERSDFAFQREIDTGAGISIIEAVVKET